MQKVKDFIKTFMLENSSSIALDYLGNFFFEKLTYPMEIWN